MLYRSLERSTARCRTSRGRNFTRQKASRVALHIHHCHQSLSEQPRMQEFGKTKIYTALQEATDDLSKEVEAEHCCADDLLSPPYGCLMPYRSRSLCNSDRELPAGDGGCAEKSCRADSRSRDPQQQCPGEAERSAPRQHLQHAPTSCVQGARTHACLHRWPVLATNASMRQDWHAGR